MKTAKKNIGRQILRIGALIFLSTYACLLMTCENDPEPSVITTDRIEYFWVDGHDNLVSTSGGAITIASGETLTIAAQGTGYVVRQWHLNGLNTGYSGNTYTFSSLVPGDHTVGLFVEKDGRLYNTNITITVE